MVGISEDGAQMKQRLRRIMAFPAATAFARFLRGTGRRARVGRRGAGTGHVRASAESDGETGGRFHARTLYSAPVWTEQSLREELLAAAHTADAKRVSALFNSNDTKLALHGGPIALRARSTTCSGTARCPPSRRFTMPCNSCPPTRAMEAVRCPAARAGQGLAAPTRSTP